VLIVEQLFAMQNDSALALEMVRLCWRHRMLKGPTMPSNPYRDLQPAGEEERAYLESLIREDLERCHPSETLDDIKRRASFSKEDRGLLRDWMAIAAKRAERLKCHD
jgi:hypothetical protein